MSISPRLSCIYLAFRKFEVVNAKRKKPGTIALGVSLLAGLSSPLFSQQARAPEMLSLREALAQCVISNPILEAARERTGSAEGLRQQAALKPNPRLTIVNENARAWEFSTPFRFAHSTDTWAYVSQTFERGAKLRSRIDFAAAGVDRAEAERSLAMVAIRARVAAAYWNAAAAARITALYREDLGAFEQIVEYNRQRVREGAAAGADLLRIEVERDRLVANERRAEQDADAARIALLREMGRQDFPAIQLTESLELLDPPAVTTAAEALEHRQEIRVARVAIRQQEKSAALQRANALVDPEIGFGYKRTAGLDGIYAGINIPLPVRNRNQGNIAAAEADTRIAQKELDALGIRIRAEVEAAQLNYAAKKAALEQTIVPLRERAREAERIALAAYREGGVELLRFLDAERVRIDTETLYYRSLAELQQSIVDLKVAEGKEL